MSQGQPARCTHTMARVRGVITWRTVSGVMFWDSGQTSANTGTAPAVTILEADARKVRGVTTTSSPAPIPSAFNAKSSATVPLARAVAYSESANTANSRSNSRQSWPVQQFTLLEGRTSRTALASSSEKEGHGEKGPFSMVTLYVVLKKSNMSYEGKGRKSVF